METLIILNVAIILLLALRSLYDIFVSSRSAAFEANQQDALKELNARVSTLVSTVQLSTLNVEEMRDQLSKLDCEVCILQDCFEDEEAKFEAELDRLEEKAIQDTGGVLAVSPEIYKGKIK